jgi:3-hydroxy-5-methyl-1-naphthoate 3-O-methyltransferase
MTDEGTEKKLNTRRLNDMGLGFMRAGTLLWALEVGLFDALSEGPRLLAELAARMGFSEDRVDKLVTACASLDLVKRQGAMISSVEDADRFLVRGKPTYFGDYLLHLAKNSYPNWGKLAEHLKSAGGRGRGRYYDSAADPHKARALTEAGYTGSQGTARVLARRFDFSPFRHLLDIGGGSAVYSIEACRRYPRLKATVLDFPAVSVVAREFIRKAGLTDRIEAIGGDFTADPFPPGHDVALLCGNIHAYDSATARRVVKKTYDVLPHGGAMIICDYMLNDEKTGPPVAAFLLLSQIFEAGSGRVHSGTEFREYMEAAEFRVTNVGEFLEGSLGWATAVKP